jgi:BA14K-like protein
MEPTMINLKVLSSVAAIALVLPMAVPSDSFAQQFKGGKGGVAVGGGRGAPAARFSGGGGAPAARFSAGAAPVAHYNGPGASSMAHYSGATARGAPAARWSGATTGTRFSTGPSVTRYSAGYGGWNGGYRHRRGGAFIPGAVAGAVIGGALASSYPYYGYGSDCYDTGYYDTGYYDDPGFYGDAAVVAAVPAPVGGDDAVAYCMQTYQSYDPASGTYLGYDGLRHPCP